jgi:glutathione peroxidase
MPGGGLTRAGRCLPGAYPEEKHAMRPFVYCGLSLAAALLCIVTLGPANAEHAAATTEAKSVLDFTMKDIDGNEVALSKFRGSVLLVVNVASKCGLTPQYEQLTALYEKYKAQGFEVLGFPANNFMGQEPGTDAEIKTFCQTKYKVSFPMFSKISVKGDDMHPLYKFLTSGAGNNIATGDINWNFEKFLVDREGKVIARFSPRTKPDAEEVVSAIEAALKTAKPAQAPA